MSHVHSFVIHQRLFRAPFRILILCLAVASQAHSADIYNNWNAQAYQIGVGAYAAQSFRTGATEITLDSVSLMLRDEFGDNPTYTAYLYSSTGSNTPNAQLLELGSRTLPEYFDSNSGTPLPDSNISFTGIGYLLTASTQYFIVLQTNEFFSWKGPASDPTGISTGPYYSLSSDDGSTWNTNPDASKPLAMVVTGTPVPEPSMILMTTIAASGLILARRSIRKK